ncbi:SoxR reducing system RseC family protein [Fusibacter tunisiensis]|uniref:Sigma-E factor negative regulatory protein RseC n=1 Tax=Fusibacter tunisiensis TaxID=1008308 RepID=A0ABS2MQC8_9FIRM|nr:SoxR reducing system RseC family protein [Fusibacter tunisiensis]MBM7561610.1 sigma-E factor negative regulatory protein RseC [Fusibacter tunisiensis]
MDRTGVVIEELGQFSKVKLLRHTACGNCGACQVGDDSKDVHLMAKNSVNAHIGDMVEVSMNTDSVLSAAFIMYVIPLVALFAGLGIGHVLFKTLVNGELYSGIFGLAVMVLAFVVIKMNDKHFMKSDKYTAQILKIIQTENDTIVPLQ